MHANCRVDSTQVDFTNPETFYHDVNSVAGLLKQFFRDLPDPLFTAALYSKFIDAARKDPTVRNLVIFSCADAVTQVLMMIFNVETACMPLSIVCLTLTMQLLGHLHWYVQLVEHQSHVC